MSFNQYSDDNPPKRGTAKKIYQALKTCGYTVQYLQYNANCWMRQLEDGWATWSCGISDKEASLECWCGYNAGGGAYLQGPSAPFAVYWLIPQQPGRLTLTESECQA